jgi:hypothetical protein
MLWVDMHAFCGIFPLETMSIQILEVLPQNLKLSRFDALFMQLMHGTSSKSFYDDLVIRPIPPLDPI